MLNPEKWIDNYGDYLYNFARQRVNNSDEAEDLVQETFLSAWKGRDNFQGKASEKTWLLSILRNKIIDHYRKTLIKDEDQSGRKEVPMSFFGEDGTWQPEAVGTEWNNLASAQVESDEFFTVFDRCKNQLKGNAFLAFTLKFIDELETEEICKELGISPTNFWVIIHRAKLAMRHCLDTNWFKTL